MTIALYLLVIVFLLTFPAETSGAALSAMRIWATSIVPSLFPYMVFGRLLGNSLHLLNLSGTPAAAALGMLGGSPTGAALIASQASRLHARSMFSLCALTGTISPMFILGTLQTWTNNIQLCKTLLLCHWICAGLSAWLTWVILKKETKQTCSVSGEAAPSFANPLLQSIDAIIQVGGCVILYSVLAKMAELLLRPVFPQLQPVLHAILEVAGGVHAIWQSSLSDNVKGILISTVLGFSGLSILTQNHAMLKSLGIRMHQLIVLGLLRAALSALLFPLLSFLFIIR